MLEFKNYSEAKEGIKQQSDYLIWLATCFETTGNHNLSSKLKGVVAAIDYSLAIIEEYTKEQKDERYQDAMKGTGAILNALVAGSKLGEAVSVLPHTLQLTKNVNK